jgi:hypothetical protein
MFGRIAQHPIKRTTDILIANNPPGFIPDEITRLLEKVYTFNVSFTKKIQFLLELYLSKSIPLLQKSMMEILFY